MNAAHHATIYSHKAQECYIAYAETKDARDAAMYKDRARHYEVLAQSAKESARRAAVKVEAVAPVAKVEAAKVEAKPRCEHRKLIARFFAIARENGLDTSAAAKPAMRHAMESAMKRCVNSRSEVTATEWQTMGDLIKSQKLAW
jgi:hypothetical protein